MRITDFVSRQVRGVWLNALRRMNGLPARLIEIGPVSRAHTGQERRSKRATFFGNKNLNRLPVDASLNPAPQRPARSSAAQANCSHRNPQLSKKRKRVLSE